MVETARKSTRVLIVLIVFPIIIIRSQWATVLTITANADARSPTSVTTMTTEERAREARTERERALRAELDRARLGEE